MTVQNSKYIKKRILQNEIKAQRESDLLLNQYKDAYLRTYKRIVDEIQALAAKATVSPNEITRTELWNYGRMINMKDMIEEEFNLISSTMVDGAEKMLSQVYVDTLGVNAKMFGKEFAIPGELQVKAVVNEVYKGSNYSARIWKNNALIANRIQTDIERMIGIGSSPNEIIKLIQEDFNTSYSNASRLVHTEASRVFANANMQSYIEYGVGMVEHISENDSCSHCKELNGTKYPVYSAPHVVKHPNCRCVYIPILD